MKGMFWGSHGGEKSLTRVFWRGDSSLKIAAASSLSLAEPCSGSSTMLRRERNTLEVRLEEEKGDGEEA